MISLGKLFELLGKEVQLSLKKSGRSAFTNDRYFSLRDEMEKLFSTWSSPLQFTDSFSFSSNLKEQIVG
jgi:hypothetical protein